MHLTSAGPSILLLLLLGACASPAPRSGFLTTYEGHVAQTGAVRAALSDYRDPEGLRTVRRVAIEPVRYADGVDVSWMNAAERALLLRELDAQLCFELSERYEVTPQAALDAAADVRVRSAVTQVSPTGRVASAASAAASFFIPGPISLRAPGTLGALAVESEMLRADGRQVAAISWRRSAQPVGADDPSLSRIGDALQFAEPFADAAAKTMSASDVDAPARRSDRCRAFGARFRPEGWVAKFATGLYVPAASGAKAATPTGAGKLTRD